MTYLIKIFFFIIILNSNGHTNELENTKIIFKLNNKIYTNIDFNKRIEYIKLLNNFEKIEFTENELNEFKEDYISSLIFNEYNISNKIVSDNINKEIDNLYEDNFLIYKIKNIQEIENIKKNLRLDIIRKKIIEKFINTNKNILNKKTENLDLIYNYNINYIIIEKNKIDSLALNQVTNRSSFLNLKDIFQSKNFQFIFKDEDINDMTKLPVYLIESIQNNKEIIFFEKKKYLTIISIEKNFESFDGVYVKLINFTSDKKLNSDNLNCKYIDYQENKVEFKEYEYSKLNKKIKENLKSIDDYITINNENGFNYIFLCDIKYDKDFLSDLNFNKKVNTLAIKIQKKILKKYKKIFNLEML